jgi:predicted DsbA family dithiol-disulfide isomerase
MDQPLPLSPITVDVVSDVVCPWCYLGKRRLEQAIAAVPDIPVAVRFRPYSLDPSVPPEGEDRGAHVIRKFGSAKALDAAHLRLEALGREAGIDYHFDRIKRSPNTLDAHRVVRWAAEAGKDIAMVDRLFAAYFSEGRDIGDHGVLGELAGEVGLNGTAIARRLATDDDKDTVKAEIDEAYQIGVMGVPTFILGGRFGVVGAQSVEALSDAIRQVAAKAASSAAMTGA